MPRRDDDDDSDLDDRPRRRRRRPVACKQGSNVVVILACIGAFLLLAIAVPVGGYFLLRAKSGPVAGTGGTGGDLERLAGAWECTFRDPTGRVTMYKVKEIAGNTETATWYWPDGRVFRINRVEFVLETRGNAKVFRYFNGWMADGLGGARQPFPSGEYMYTLEGDTWTEFGPFGETIVWTRKR